MNNDDWVKPRSRATHLTDSEIETIRTAYKTGIKARVIARELQCSSRTVVKYYGLFHAEGVSRSGTPKPPAPVHLPIQMEGSVIALPSKARLMAGK